MKFTEFTEQDNKKVTDETIVNEAEPAFKLDIKALPQPANDNKAPDVKDIRNQLKLIQGGLDDAGQKELQKVLKNKSLWSRLGSWGAKTAGRHAGATVASTVTGPVAPAVALVANLALLGYDVYSLGDTIWDWANEKDGVDLKKADAGGATGDAPFTAPPRPTSQGGRNKRIDRWDRLYGKTHNADGTPIQKYNMDTDPYREPRFKQDKGTAQEPSVQTDIVTPTPYDTFDPSLNVELPQIKDKPEFKQPEKLKDPDPNKDGDPNIDGDPDKVIIPNIPGITQPKIVPEPEIEIPPVITPYTPPATKKAPDQPPVGNIETLPNIDPKSIIVPLPKPGGKGRTPPTKRRTTPPRRAGGLPSLDQKKPTYKLNPFTPLPMPDPMNLSRYKSFGESIDEREMTKKEKAKEKRLKKKYDDSDMKASMKKQYGKDWKTVYYATIRKQAMDEGYQILPSIDKARYDEIQGMEGPMMTASGKVLYYDPQEGAYYDRDSDMYLSYEEFKQYDEPMRADEGHSPHKKGTKKYNAHMAAMHANEEAQQRFSKIMNNAKSMSEAPGDEELLKPMVDMDPKVLPIYAKNIIKKYPHLKPSVDAMIGKQESVATEGKNKMGPQGMMPGDRVEHEGEKFEVVDVSHDPDAPGTIIADNLETGLRNRLPVAEVTKLYGMDAMTDQDKENAEAMFKRLKKAGSGSLKHVATEGEAGDHDRMYKVVHVKKGVMDIKAKTSYEAAKKFAKEKGLKSTAGVDAHLYPLEEASSPWTSSGKHPEDMDRDELQHEIDIFKQYQKMGMSLSPQEIMRMDSLYDYLDAVDEECRYCGGDCPNDEENACDGYLGDIDNLYGTRTDENLNEGYEGEISAILQALDIEHHWSDGRLHVNKRDVDDVRDRLADTDMEMPDISIYEDDMSYGAQVAAMGTAGAAGLYGAKKGIEKYGPAVVDKTKTAIKNKLAKSPKPQGSPSKLGKLAKVGKGVLGKAAWPIALGMAGYDAVRGYRADPNASFTQKMKNAGNTALDGISFGTLGKDATRESLQAQGFTVQDLKEKVDQFILVKENVDTMRKIVANKSATPVKFEDGTMKVDMTTANIFLQAFDKMRDDNQAKVAEMMRTKKGFLRVMDIIYGAMK